MSDHQVYYGKGEENKERKRELEYTFTRDLDHQSRVSLKEKKKPTHILQDLKVIALVEEKICFRKDCRV